MKILIGCEFSGVLREAFKAKGHDSWSCDLLPSDIPGQHIQGNLLDILDRDFDMMICHPPCVHLAVSGARWFKDKQKEQQEALSFVRRLLEAPIAKICLENPVSIISTKIRKPDQIIQPYHFGSKFQKTTCLWLKNLPKLTKTSNATKGIQQCWLEPPSPDRWKIRSKTDPFVAKAMAEQWGNLE